MILNVNTANTKKLSGPIGYQDFRETGPIHASVSYALRMLHAFARILIGSLACVKGVERGRGLGGREKKEGDWGERVRNTCYKNPPFFISADAGVR